MLLISCTTYFIYNRYLDNNIAAAKRLPNFLQLLKLPLLSKDKLNQLRMQERIKNSQECLEIIDKAAKTACTDADNSESSPWSRPRNGVRKSKIDHISPQLHSNYVLNA